MSMKKLKKDLEAVTKEFDTLTRKIRELRMKLKKTAGGQLEKARVAVKSKSTAQHAAQALKTLTKTIDKMIKAVEKFEKEQAAKKPRAKAKTKATKKARAKKTPAKKKATALTATDQVLNIIKRSKKGVDVPTLMKKTGFDDKKVRNIINRTLKQGKVKRVGRGIYVAA